MLPMTMPIAAVVYCTRKSLMPITNCVEAGRSAFISLNVCAKVGTTCVIMSVPIPPMAIKMMQG